MYTAYVNYVIWFSDQIEYNAAIAATGGNGYGHCPFLASATFTIPWPPAGGGPVIGTKGIYGLMPYGIPGPGGVEVYNPQASGKFLESEVDFVIVPGQPSNPAGSSGQDLKLTWWGAIVFASTNVTPSGGGPPGPATTPIPQRRWIGGWESGGSGSEGLLGYSAGNAKVASRTVDGHGYLIRGTAASGKGEHFVAEYIAGYEPKTSWERFYFRIRSTGVEELRFWRCIGSPSINGAVLGITAAGELIAYSVALADGSGGAVIDVKTAALNLDEWYLCDVLIKFPTGAPDFGNLRVYLNHTKVIDGNVTNNQGLDTDTFHYSSLMGIIYTVSQVGWALDLDDWICADVPNNLGVESLDSLDWAYGSHVRMHHIEAATFTDWVGSVQGLWGQQNPGRIASSDVLTSTGLATIESTLMDVVYDDMVAPGVIYGPVAIWVASNCITNVDAQTGRIGYSLAGGAYVYANIVDTNTAASWRGNLYSQAGVDPDPTDITPFNMIKEASAAGVNYILNSLCAIVEYIGVWGLEDDPLFPLDLSNSLLFLHNSRYANTIFGLLPFGGEPDASVMAFGGTYIGNDTGQDIDLPGLPHFVFIRSTTGGSQGLWWHGPDLSVHEGGRGTYFGNQMPRVWVDSTGQPKLAISGSNTECNAAGVVYQYIVFCDPGMRFAYSNAYNILGTEITHTFPLFVPTFTPQAGFVHREFPSDGGANVYLHYKGTGHAGDTGQVINGTALASWGTFGLGEVTLKASNIWTDFAQATYLLWRTTDASGYVAVQITNYTGDGTGTRVIPLPLVTGRWPLWAYVQPHNAVGWVRDPSHTLLSSSQIGSLNVSSNTAIRGGGPDEITVGSTLNANGIEYEVFVILGDDAGWNNGTYYPPNGPAEGEWEKPVFNPGDEPILIGSGGLDFDGAPATLLVESLSGIYTLVPGKLNDTLYTGNADETMDLKIADPTFKTGYIGG